MVLKGSPMSENTNDFPVQVAEEEASNLATETLRGRSIFLVETTASGIAVQTSFMSEDGKLLQLPAIFPDVQYALAQIDELRSLVMQHFSKAAQVGAKVIAQQTAESAENIKQDNAA
jgi:excinuclease UvrABC nuclease subunit